jgi:Ferritin-like
MNDSRSITTRTDLLKLLCEAAELEHGIACSYLYAAFSLKRDVSEGGMTWEEQQKVRRWAAQIYFVASQEMLHLALVWNLTTAIGGTPYYFRPNFPQGPKYYPLKVPIALEPFGTASLRRFILYEHPRNLKDEQKIKSLLTFPGEDAEDIQFGTVGELYGLIESGFRNIDEKELFIGSPTQQMDPTLVHFPDLVPVVDRASAIKAIGEITEQGEGSAHDREDSHFGAFVSILNELCESKSQGTGFSPARPALRNPSADLERAYGALANPIDDPLAGRVAALFDSDIMPRVLLPLGEGLMLMPAGKKYPGKTAGPGFGLTRHIMLPPSSDITLQLCRERVGELAALAADVMNNELPQPVQKGCSHLRVIADSF